MRNIPDNSDDTIDSRDVIARISEIEDERDSLDLDIEEKRETLDDAQEALGKVSALEMTPGDSEGLEAMRGAVRAAESLLADAVKARQDWDETDEAEELRILNALASQGANSCDDWGHGATLIRDSYFQDYAEEFASDIGAINADATWPNNCIDWERAARELRSDYSSVEFDGVTYWVR